MKLKYFFPIVIAVLTTLVTSCSDEDVVSYLDNVRVTSSYVALPAEGGSTSIDVTASGDWTISDIPEWVTVSPTSGSGDATVTFTAPATSDSKEAYVTIECKGDKQQLKVMQIAEKMELPISTCDEVLKGSDNVSYRIKGTVTKIENTTYGNMYIYDGTGEVYIYGTLDAKGAEKNFASLGIEVGDEVDCEGPRVTYNGTIELKNVTVNSINKSLIKVDSTYVAGVESNTLPLEGGELTAYVSCKGKGVSVDIPEDAKEWLSISAIKNGGSEVVFKATPNTGGDRNTTVFFKTTDGKKEYSSQMTIAQKGAIVPLTVAEFNAKEVGDAQYRLTGLVTKVDDAAAGKYYISDYTGQVYVYKASGEVALNDVVTIVGKHAEYKGTPQVGSGQLEEICASAEPISLADFNAAADDNDKRYVLTGKIVEIANDTYGNLYIEDETGEKVYLYGVYGDWTGENKKYFITDNGIAVGDEITVVTIKTSYKDTPQGKNAVCFGVKKAE
ncbi:MAG: BACON domain-containing carbohydrate-binding protein [Prevotella sp.]|nr:BACON domain-containing carbohydrate-binding protein [Prevotella sp.]